MSQPHRPPSVNLNLNVRGMGGSATMAVAARCQALRAQGRELFALGLGESPFPVPPPVVRALQAHAHERGYPPVAGLPALREAVADHHRRVDGIECGAEDVLVGPGSKALMFLLQLVYYGDLVIPTPAWVSYAPQARILGRHVHLLPTRRADGWRLDAERLHAICHEDSSRPRIVVLNYPSNPTGVTYEVDELVRLAEVAREHEMVLLSDEIYGALHHRGEHVSIARFYPEGTIVSGGLSKWCGAGGWRLGTFLVPPPMRWLLEAMAAVASETYTTTGGPIQHAAVEAYREHPEIEAYLGRTRRVLGALGRWCAEQLRSSGLACPEPAGAFYLFPDFEARREELAARGIRTGAGLCDRLLEDTGVVTLAGSVFGRPAEELTLRIAYVDFDGAAALEAVEDLPAGEVGEAWLEGVCGRTVQAVGRLRSWLASL